MFQYCHLEKNASNYTNYSRENFGVLKFKTQSVPLSSSPLYIHFTLDYSGSMCEETRVDYTSKLDLVIQTIIQIIHFLYETFVETENSQLVFQIDRFNDDYKNIYPLSNLPKTDTQVGEFANTFKKKNFPMGNTYMELALKSSRETIEKYMFSHKNTRVLHFFLTDGEATVGKTGIQDLVNIIKNSLYPTVYIGYGEDHNSKLLNELAKHSGSGSSYEYIHNYEKIANVYGEVLHKYLYPAIQSISLVCKDCCIYDPHKKGWYSELKEGTIAGDQERVYSLCLNNDNEHSSISIYDNNVLLKKTTIEYTKNLIIYILRQKTVELLEKCVNCSRNKNNVQHMMLKKEINELYEEIKALKENMPDDQDVLMLQVLSDDLYICYSTLGTHLGKMISLSRYSTHVRQTRYRVDLDSLMMDAGVPRINSPVGFHDPSLDLENNVPCLASFHDETQEKEENQYEMSIEQHDYDSTRELLYSPHVKRTIDSIESTNSEEIF